MEAVAIPVMVLVAPGPEVTEHHARLTGGPRIAIRHVRGGLLVADKDVFDVILAEECVIDMKRGTSGITVYIFDALVLEGPDEHFGTRQ